MRLLAAAEQLLADEGLDALTVRRVADEVGTTTRAVYSLFGSKEGLLVALASHAFDILLRKLTGQRLTGDPRADLAKAGLAFRAFALEHPALFRLAIQRELPDPALAQEYAAAARRAFMGLEARVRQFVDVADLDLDVHDAAVQYHALCEGLAAVELRGGLLASANTKPVWTDALANLVAGFASKRPGT